MMKRLFAFAVLLAVFATACSAGPSRIGAGSDKAGALGASGQPSSSESHGISVNEDGTVTGGHMLPQSNTSTSAGKPSPWPTVDDTILAKVNEYAYWDCTFRVGTSCKIPYQGNYILVTQLHGFLAFAAYEDDSKTPAKVDRFPVPRGSTPFNFKMKYTVGLRAKTVTFTCWLEGEDGRVLSQGIRQSFPVTAPAKTH